MAMKMGVPNNWRFRRVLKHQVPGAFCVTGHFVKDQPQLVKRMAEEGHIIGNHSYHHPDLTKRVRRKLQKELDSVNGSGVQNYGKTR